MYACFFNFPDCVTVLMQNGAQYKLRRGDHGRGILPDPSCSCYLPYASSALHIAALRGNYDACWALLSAYFNSLSPVWIADGYRTNALEIGVTRIDPRLLADSVRRTPFEIARQMDLFNLLPLLNPVTPISVALDDRELRLMGPLSLKKIAASVAQAVLLDQVAALASQLLAMKEKKDKKRVEKQGQAETEGGKTSAMVDMSHLDHSNNPMGQDLLALSGPFVLPSPVSQHQRLDDMLHLQMSFSDILVQQERRLAAMMTQMLAPPPPNRTSLIQIPESSAELSGAFVEENGSNPSQFISGAASPHHLPTAQSPTWHANTTFKKDSQPMGSSPVQCSSPPYYTSSEVPYKPSQAELQQHIYGALMALVSGADENEDDVIEEHHENEETEPELEEREAAEEAWEEEEEEEEITGWLEGGGGGGGAGKKKATTTTTAGNHLDKTLAAARSHRLVHGVNTSNLFGLNLLSITAPAPAVQDSPLPSPSPAGPGANTSILRLSHKSMDATSGRSSMLRQRLNHALSSQPPSPSASQSQLSASAAEDACGVCFDEGNGFISILPCNHKICCPCAKELIYLHPTDPIPCPFCRGLVRGFEL